MVLFTHLAGRRTSVLSRTEELQTPTGSGAALPNHFICSLAVWLPYTSAGFGQGRRLKRKSIILSPLSVSFIPVCLCWFPIRFTLHIQHYANEKCQGETTWLSRAWSEENLPCLHQWGTVSRSWNISITQECTGLTPKQRLLPRSLRFHSG